jgi:hypothetical protein
MELCACVSRLDLVSERACLQKLHDYISTKAGEADEETLHLAPFHFPLNNIEVSSDHAARWSKLIT